MISPTKAIKLKCIECIYDPQSPGTVLVQVSRCTSYGCPLYPLRPKSAIQKRAEKAERDALLTPEQIAQRAESFRNRLTKDKK